MSWAYASAIRGKLGDGSPGDDVCRIAWVGPAIVFVVADGAGSANLGGVGARITCETFVASAAKLLQPVTVGGASDATDPARAILADVRARVNEEAFARDVEPMALAATLVGAVVTDTEAIFIQVGDGAAVYRMADDYELAIVPEETEFVNTTFFVTSPDAEAHLQVRRIEGRLEEVALFSDGLQGLVLHTVDHRPHATFFGTVFRTLRAAGEDTTAQAWLANMLASDMVTNRTDDDTSIVIAKRLPS